MPPVVLSEKNVSFFLFFPVNTAKLMQFKGSESALSLGILQNSKSCSEKMSSLFSPNKNDACQIIPTERACETNVTTFLTDLFETTLVSEACCTHIKLVKSGR